jgi:hypothetical protein
VEIDCFYSLNKGGLCGTNDFVFSDLLYAGAAGEVSDWESREISRVKSL